MEIIKDRLKAIRLEIIVKESKIYELDKVIEQGCSRMTAKRTLEEIDELLQEILILRAKHDVLSGVVFGIIVGGDKND